jgi:hypothetical protein
MQECLTFLDGRATHASDLPGGTPTRGDSATRAGTLARGQYRGIPGPIRGMVANEPESRHYAPGDGHARIRDIVASYRAHAQERAAFAREMRAARQARRAAHVARDGYQHASGTYCAGYRPGK